MINKSHIIDKLNSVLKQRDRGNVGCGHVYPRPDGRKNRCGGPRLCKSCAADLATKEASTLTDEEIKWIHSTLKQKIDDIS